MATMKKYQTGGPVDKKTKSTTKKTKTASQRIGDLTLRDVKNSGETALNLSTLGGYGVAKKKIKKLTGMKAGGKLSKARNGKPVKKAFLGSLLGGVGKSMLGGLASQALGGLMGGGAQGGGGQAAGGQGSTAQAPMQRKSTDMTPVKTRGMMKKGGKVTKAKNGKSFPDLNKDGKITKADILKGRGVIAKKGMSVKKCKYGCK